MIRFQVFAGVLALGVLLSACAAPSRQLTSVWSGEIPPPASLKAPVGFQKSPLEAVEIVRAKPWRLSLKHPWHIYADDEYYYVYDAFLGSNPTRAYKTGVRVNGTTGQIHEHSSERD